MYSTLEKAGPHFIPCPQKKVNGKIVLYITLTTNKC